MGQDRPYELGSFTHLLFVTVIYLRTHASKERIVVEHDIRGIKIFRRIGEIITIRSDELFSTTLLAAANLSNFKRLVRQGLG